MPRSDVPLSRIWNDSFVAQLPLDDALVKVDPCHHLLAHFISSHRLHNVPQFDTLANIFPLLEIGLMTL